MARVLNSDQINEVWINTMRNDGSFIKIFDEWHYANLIEMYVE
jgi:hypothetical protein